jgi:hypothetical protein
MSGIINFFREKALDFILDEKSRTNSIFPIIPQLFEVLFLIKCHMA